jgi:putative endonuclease
MHYVYLLQHTKTYEKYIGQTSDIVNRLNEHNSGRQISTKRNSGEWKIIYAEIFRSKSDALAREKKLKNNSRGRQELYKRILKSELKK